MYPSMSTFTTNDSSFLDNSSTFIKDFSNLQQTSSTSQYHSHIVYSNNSFHMYDHLITNNNIYNEQPSVLEIQLSPSMNTNICPSYDYRMNSIQPISRRRRQRTVFTRNHIQQLDSVFVYNQYPDIDLRETLAAQMGISESRIQVWFKNRRTRARTTQRQQFKILES